MLAPAVLYKDDIIKEFKKKYYTDDMMYYVGYSANIIANIADEPDESTFQYAVVDKDLVLKGYIVYHIDWYSSCAYNFGIMSFDKHGILMGEALNEVMNKLIDEYHLHRISWQMVSGNPVQKTYDRFCKKYNGNRVILHDVFKDTHGNYHDSYYYEIISDKY